MEKKKKIISIIGVKNEFVKRANDKQMKKMMDFALGCIGSNVDISDFYDIVLGVRMAAVGIGVTDELKKRVTKHTCMFRAIHEDKPTAIEAGATILGVMYCLKDTLSNTKEDNIIQNVLIDRDIYEVIRGSDFAMSIITNLIDSEFGDEYDIELCGIYVPDEVLDSDMYERTENEIKFLNDIPEKPNSPKYYC